MKYKTKLARPFIFYVASLLFFGVGAITSIGLNWYGGLVLPSWTPPEILVASIWAVLFFCTAYSLAIFWETSTRSESSFKWILFLYTANAMLILLWNYLFFGAHALSLAFYVAIAVGLSVLLLVVQLWKEARTASLLLLPYLAWMVFALTLTYTVILLNP